MNIRTSWLATFTRRWHTNPLMCHTVDTIGDHSARMALLADRLWPDASRDLILACLKHDLHESVLGDLPPAGKERLRRAYEIEAGMVDVENGWHVVLGHTDATRLKFLDRLDAYLFAHHHWKATGDDWSAGYEWLKASADVMGISDKLAEVLQ